MSAYIRHILLLLLCFDETLTQESTIKYVKGKNSTEYTCKPNVSKIVHSIDLLIADVTNQQWTTDEGPCLHKVLDILKGVKNSTLWATWIWDSMQSPSGVFYGSRNNLGNYDQCMKAPWLKTHKEYRTQYCLADIKLSDEEQKNVKNNPHGSVQNFINSKSELGLTFNTITWGVCVPVECNSKATAKFVRALFKQTHLGVAMSPLEVKIDEPCQVPDAVLPYSTLYVFFFLFFGFSIAISVICTFLNCNDRSNSRSSGNRIVKAFCLQENIANLCKVGNNDIYAIHATKFSISFVVILLHVWLILFWTGAINSINFEEDYKQYNFKSFYHSELIVDTYFMISGLLSVNSMLFDNNKLLWVIFKRYLRLLRLPVFLLLFGFPILLRLADGPRGHRMIMAELNYCTRTAWLGAFMLQNYVDTTNMCYPVMWSVPCDFHFYTIGAILFWTLKKNRRAGLTAFTILLIAATIIPGVTAYQRKLMPVPNFTIKAITNSSYFRKTVFNDPLYLHSHLRISPYLVGIALGYVISIYKPSEHRKIISKFWSTVVLISAVATSLLIIMIGGIFHDHSRPYNVWEAALFAAFNRTIWAIASACIIAICEYGTAPIVDSVLRSPIFRPLSKLSYGTYLVHMTVFFSLAGSSRTPLTYSKLTLIFNAFGVITMSLLISFLLHVFYESPINKISTILWEKMKDKQNEISRHQMDEVNEKKTM